MSSMEEQVGKEFDDHAKDGSMNALFDNTGYITIGYFANGNESLGESARNITMLLGEISEMGPKSQILDLGCGSGRPALDLAVKFGCSVVGVDLSEEHINMAKMSEKEYKEMHPDINAEFYQGSFFEIPKEVMDKVFSHVIMQTSLFYAHHDLDNLFGQIEKILKPGGTFLATDFYRKTAETELKEFMEFNGMSRFLSLDEMKGALLRNNLKFVSSEDLNSHCIKCHDMAAEKMHGLNFTRDQVKFCEVRSSHAKADKVCFHLLIANRM